MKKQSGFALIWVVVGIAVAALIGVGAYFIIDGNSKLTDFGQYDFYTIIEGNKDNGGISDHIKGEADAPVVIYEYADYQCEACAAYNPRINKVVEELDGKLAVVYRSFLLSYHKNATAAASAAEAAGLQGYWKEYADKLFEEQSEWYYASPTRRTELFDGYFMDATGGKGDLEKFKSDIKSEEVSKKISFDMGIAKRLGVSGTPAFYIDGQQIKFGDAGEVTVNGKKISWDEAQSGDDFVKLIKDIVDTKLGE